MSTVVGADKFVAKMLKDFATNLQFIRGKRKMSYRELGDRSGMTERNAYQIVNGKQGATTSSIGHLADALQVDPSDLFMDHRLFRSKHKDAGPLAPLSVRVNGVKRTEPQHTSDLLERTSA